MALPDNEDLVASCKILSDMLPKNITGKNFGYIVNFYGKVFKLVREDAFMREKKLYKTYVLSEIIKIEIFITQLSRHFF